MGMFPCGAPKDHSPWGIVHVTSSVDSNEDTFPF
ncbi:hypothetical protein BVRB_003670 [Beta vulgaris subsp. vulgaris]|uniref:Uncharacterized protein n=1 Tax=Beta vulgaris subsp. vulgaris TaxID=3555 RepID=A0A0J8B4M2_BETVV|nr:hypothetical protein BVRB_003670 [Beta vulgaris subsp. vulgaris]